MIINDGHGTEVNRVIDISCALISHVKIWIQSLIPNIQHKTIFIPL